MKKLLLGLLLLYSVNILEASSSQQIAIGYNPADFTIVGNATPGAGLASMVVTDLVIFRCSYVVVATGDPSIMEAINKEIEFSSSTYIDPTNRLTYNPTVATHWVKGKATFMQGNVSINLRIEDHQGSLIAKVKVSGPEDRFFKLTTEATKSLANQMCPEAYYTATYTKKIKKTAKVLKKYRGMGKDLKNVNEDHLEFYIFVDVNNGKVVQHLIEDKSYRKTHKERYKLNMQSCQYEIKVKDKQVPIKGARALLRSDDMGWGIEDETIFYVKLPFSDERIAFSWKTLKKQGGIQAHKSYSHAPFAVSKDIKGKFGIDAFGKASEKEMKKQAKNSADYITKAENDSDLKKFQKFVTVPGTPKDIQCGMDVSMESMMMQPIDGTLPQKISVELKIRQSTESEIEEMKASMEKNR